MVDLDTRNRVQEARIVRAVAPNCYRLAGMRRWRWDLTTHREVEGSSPGVLDQRKHLHGDCGYTFTRLGALLAMGRRMSDV